MSAPSKRSGLNRLRWRVAAFYRHRLGELSAEIAVRSELTEECLTQRLRLFVSFGIGLLDLRRAAFDGVARQFHRGFGGKSEGDEEGRIVDVDLDLLALRIKRLLEGQREVEREQALVVVERIVLRRFQRQKGRPLYQMSPSGYFFIEF